MVAQQQPMDAGAAAEWQVFGVARLGCSGGLRVDLATSQRVTTFSNVAGLTFTQTLSC